jgi:flagellar operon protein
MSTHSLNPALLQPVGATAPSEPAARTQPSGPGFAGVLSTQPDIRFSSHALQRIERRGIDVSPQTLHRLQDGVNRAASKGARDSVVFVNGTAFVVSVTNKTVVTAVDQSHMRDFVFTNIDSAVIA